MLKYRSHFLAQITDLVGIGKKKFTWISEHVRAFDDMKTVMIKETIFNYPKSDQYFDIHTDARDR